RDGRGRTRGARQIDELAAALVDESAQVLHASQRRANIRDAHAAPRRDVRYGRGSERAKMPPYDDVVRGFRLRRLSQPGRRRDVAAELPVLEMGAGGLPHQPARGDGGPAEPVPEPFVLRGARRQMVRDELLDLGARARSLPGERHDGAVKLSEVRERGAA